MQEISELSMHGHARPLSKPRLHRESPTNYEEPIIRPLIGPKIERHKQQSLHPFYIDVTRSNQHL